MIAKLALEDGTVFTGTAVGALRTSTGEVVFNTALTGYQEVFTDPSYCGQIVTMTFPLQGNYGVNDDDNEAAHTYIAGVVLRELPRRPSNHRATCSLADFLATRGIPGLVGVDTRALTRRIRTAGALRGVLSTKILDEVELVRRAQAAPSMAGANLVTEVAPTQTHKWAEPPHMRAHIVAVDCGVKQNMLRLVADAGCRVTVVPAGTSAGEILDYAPTGVLLSNGPGDPAAVTDTIAAVRGLLGRLPIFGICLGHQLLALALGARTYKLRFGHHGVNLPVLQRETGRVEITSQNHGFAVDVPSLERAGGTVTHVNLNDGSLEGFGHRDLGVMAVQFHPEANPGPHDARHLFAKFVSAL